MKAYIVTEGQTDAEILKKLLPKDLVENTEFVVGSGKYSVQSLARSLLATKQLPVAVVLDSDTRDVERIREQEEFYRETLRQASSGAKFEVFFAKPTLEDCIFEDPVFARWLANQEFSKAELDVARSHPKRFLWSLQERGIAAPGGLFERLDNKTLAAIRRQPFLSGLAKFLSSVAGRRN